MKGKVVSVDVKETQFQKIITTKTESDCYCSGILGLPKDFGPCLACKGTGKSICTLVTKHSKYFCLNGPQIGLRFTTEDMMNADPNYTLYNCGSRSEPNFKCVWVWDKSLVDYSEIT